MDNQQLSSNESIHTLSLNRMEAIRKLVDEVNLSLETLKKLRYNKLASTTCVMPYYSLTTFIKEIVNYENLDRPRNPELKQNISKFQKCFLDNSQDLLNFENDFTNTKNKNLQFLVDQLKNCNNSNSKECIAEAFTRSTTEIKEELELLNFKLQNYLV